MTAGQDDQDRFLVIQLRQIGDVVLTTPLLRILKEARPGCRVAMLTEKPSDQLLKGNPYVDEILLNNRKGSWRDTLRLGLELRRRRFSAVVDPMSNPRSAILAWLSGAPTRIAYRSSSRGWFYTHRVEVGKQPYAVDVKKRLLTPLGIESPWRRPEIFLTQAERTEGRLLRDSLLGVGDRRLITLDPSHRRATRRWPAEHFGALCRLVKDRWAARPVVLWGPGEEADADAVVSTSGGAAVKAPGTSLRQMAALIGAADLHVGNCSAPRHIAVAVGTPTFTILGSTSSGWTFPHPSHTQTALGLPCQPCNRNDCPRDLVCLRDLEPAVVSERLSSWLARELNWDLP